MSPRERRLAAFVFAAALLGLALGAIKACAAPERINSSVTTIKLQDGVSPSAGSDFFRDTYMCSATPDSGLNHGTADTLRVAGFANAATFKSKANRILMSIDIRGALPDSSEIRRVRLFLYCVLGTAGNPADTLEVCRVLQPWNEGTGGVNGAAQAANADWRNHTGKAWISAGASTQPAANPDWLDWYTSGDSSTVNPPFTGQDSLSYGGNGSIYDCTRSKLLWVQKSGTVMNRLGWQAVDITSLCRGWQSGTYENNGLLIRTHNNAANKVWGFASSEAPYKLRRPYVVIEYIDFTGGNGSSQSGGSGASTRLGIPGRSMGLGGS